VAAELDAASWDLPPVIAWLSQIGGLAPTELLNTFNCGLGMIVVVEAASADRLTALLQEAGETVHRVGQLVSAAPGAAQVVVSAKAGTWGSETSWRV
jgi:phosphoribosylformylglycinamidine cyclo-ligase